MLSVVREELPSRPGQTAPPAALFSFVWARSEIPGAAAALAPCKVSTTWLFLKGKGASQTQVGPAVWALQYGSGGRKKWVLFWRH